jgi:hypothetical protein
LNGSRDIPIQKVRRAEHNGKVPIPQLEEISRNIPFQPFEITKGRI